MNELNIALKEVPEWVADLFAEPIQNKWLRQSISSMLGGISWSSRIPKGGSTRLQSKLAETIFYALADETLAEIKNGNDTVVYNLEQATPVIEYLLTRLRCLNKIESPGLSFDPTPSSAIAKMGEAMAAEIYSTMGNVAKDVLAGRRHYECYSLHAAYAFLTALVALAEDTRFDIGYRELQLSDPQNRHIVQYSITAFLWSRMKRDYSNADVEEAHRDASKTIGRAIERFLQEEAGYSGV